MLRAWALCVHRTSLCAHYAHAYKCPCNFLRPVKHRISTHRKKNITRSIQRKIKYILLIISSMYFYIHRTLTFFLEISGGKYEIIRRKWNFHTLSFFSYLVFLLQASIHKTAGEQIWKSLKTFLCSFETGMTTFYFDLWCMM